MWISSACMFSCSVAFDSVTLWAIAHQTLLSIGFSRQEYWSGLPFPPPVYSALASGFFTTELSRKPWINSELIKKKKRKKINHSGGSREWIKRKVKKVDFRWKLSLEEPWHRCVPFVGICLRMSCVYSTEKGSWTCNKKSIACAGE